MGCDMSKVLPLSKFPDVAARAVREDSKKMKKPTPASEIKKLDSDLTEEEFQQALAGLPENPRYKDIKIITAFNEAVYLFSEKHVDAKSAERMARSTELEKTIVEKIRSDSRDNLPTEYSTFLSLAPELETGELDASLAEILVNEDYSDIKSVVAFNGAAYYHSDRYLSDDIAIKTVRSLELKKETIKTIRDNTRNTAKLTPISRLLALAPGLTEEELQGTIKEIIGSGESPDIKMITGRKGVPYLYSDISMANNYAKILLRIEEKDPCYTIAETVREESRVYPRATNIRLFLYPPFNMEHDKLAGYVEETLKQYEDIKKLEQDKLKLREPGHVFLYSEKYMSEMYAISLARDEVEGDR